jgi:hypothetical protein
MSLNWILHPLVQYSLQIGAISACLYLFLDLKNETRKTALRSRAAQEALEDSMDQLKRAVEKMRDQTQRMEETAARVVDPPLAVSGLNLNKRGQALRMHHRGEAPGEIAAALTLPEREVELLLKVQRLYDEAAREKSATA